MKWLAAIVAFVLVVVAVVVAFRPGDNPEEFRPVADQGEAGRTGGPPPPFETLSEDEVALARLRAEIARAEPVAYRSDEQRLAEAQAWVAANRPDDWPYSDIEAKMLALMDVFADGEKKSAEWMLNMSQIELEMIRAIDADGDGQVTDEEVQLFIDDGLGRMFGGPMEHPYLQAKFDTDGDGEVSPEEMATFASNMSNGPLSGVFERGRVNEWDADNDGFVSEEERVAGEQAADDRFKEVFGQMVEALDTSTLSEEQQAEITAQQEQALEGSREMLRNQAIAQELMEAMRLDDMPQPDTSEIMADMPQPPDWNSFDTDGDQSLSETEQAALNEAMAEYQETMQDWGAVLTANRLRQQFDHAAAAHDSDGDGRLTDGEWDRRISDLLVEREQRMLLINYDLDESGHVDAIELNTFLSWYGQESLRADANLDGLVDRRDLEQMVTMFQRQ